MTSKHKTDWWLYSVPVLYLLTVICYFIIQSRPGTLGLLLFMLAPLAIGFLSVVFFIIGLIYALKHRPFFRIGRTVAFIGLIALCFSGIIYKEYPSYYDDKPSKVKFRIPVNEEISVAWGGETLEQNYHAAYPDQRWAYDLFVVRDGKTFSGDSTKLEHYFSYGLKILAPADGKVIKAYDADPDMQPGILGGGKDPHGNHIILEVAKKEFLFLCHLQPGSIKVKKGDTVKQGDELALLGNSGNTSEPHLHLHLQNTKKLSIGEAIPLYFHNYLLNGKHISRGIPTGGFDEDGTFIGQTVQIDRSANSEF